MFGPLTSCNTNELLKRSSSGKNPTDTLVGKTVVLQRKKRDGSHEVKQGVVEHANETCVDIVGRSKKLKHYELKTWTIIDIITH